LAMYSAPAAGLDSGISTKGPTRGWPETLPSLVDDVLRADSRSVVCFAGQKKSPTKACREVCVAVTPHALKRAGSRTRIPERMYSRRAVGLALVPTLRVGTYVRTLCVRSGAGARRRASRRAFPRGAWERGVKKPNEVWREEAFRPQPPLSEFRSRASPRLG